MPNQFMNVQVIDSALNCVYDIFATTPEEFSRVFPSGTDVAFIDEVYERYDAEELNALFTLIWQRRVRKQDAAGIHGTLFYGLANKKQFYPTRRDDEAVNPDGTRLR
jgi:hypothetical protein